MFEFIKAELKTIELYAILALLAAVVGLAGWNHILRADNRAMAAQVQPLRQAAKDAAKLDDRYRTELQQCEASKLALKQANDDAIAQAGKDAQAAFASGEAYQKTLDSSPKGCDSILKATVCPALMGY